ncbi:MAG TPA: PilZ domain-containing protein [Terriglobales bacterium]|nr:PilZ domain-containing protein [Terriglobales bacterium]
MEGPCIRRFPRILLTKPVELRSGDSVIFLESAQGNLSAGGLFVTTQGATPAGEVRLRIVASRPFETQGIVRHFMTEGSQGVGIEFSQLPEQARQDLELLISELTRDGAPAA